MPIANKKKSAHNWQSWYIKLPPLILPKREATNTSGNITIKKAVNTIIAYRL
jgi:hypothetical protein